MKLTCLDTLHLQDNTNITNNALETLKNLTSLRVWNELQISNDALKKLTNLTDLSVRGTKIDDESIKYLVNLRTLILNSSSHFISRILGFDCPFFALYIQYENK